MYENSPEISEGANYMMAHLNVTNYGKIKISHSGVMGIQVCQDLALGL
jgi:hypothetical protein